MHKEGHEVEDGKIQVIGPDLDEIKPGPGVSLGIMVEVYGRKMQPDFEPIFERQMHRFLGEAQGLFHMGQRDMIRHRISKEAFKAGFRIKHIGSIIHAKFHGEFGAILDKVQVTLYTKKEDVERLLKDVCAAYTERDARLKGMTDDSVNLFYSCTLCQSFAPTHICVVTPERSGLCGSVSWLDGKAGYEISPTGPNQPIERGKVVNENLGQWEGTNSFIFNGSNRSLEKVSLYSIMTDPMTSCGCFECISAMLPMTNGIMVVDRDFTEMTPCGMKFSTLGWNSWRWIANPRVYGSQQVLSEQQKIYFGGWRSCACCVDA